MNLRLRLITLAAALATTPALAHPAIGHMSGFGDGFAHPLGGLDHLLAMVAVGVLAAQLGGRALALVPAAFVLAMAGGFALATAGVGLPFVEIAIGLSVVVLGAAVALRLGMPAAAAMALVGAFAVFHGHAHGSELPADASGLAYMAGFGLSTALLHLVGVALGLAAGLVGGTAASRVAGGGVAAAGLLLLTGAL